MNDYVNISGDYKIINLLILIQIHKLILMKPIEGKLCKKNMNLNFIFSKRIKNKNILKVFVFKKIISL